MSLAVACFMGNAPATFAIVSPLFKPYGIFSGYPINLSSMNVFWKGWGSYVSLLLFGLYFIEFLVCVIQAYVS